MMAGVLPNQEEVKVALRTVLFEPMCPANRLLIMQRLQGSQDATKSIRKLHRKYDLADIATVAWQIIRQARQARQDDAAPRVVSAHRASTLEAPSSSPSPLARTVAHGSGVNMGTGDTSHECQLSSDAEDELQLPLPVQHLILSRMQTLLEETCFSFTTKQMPEMLAARGWTCAEAIELNVWLLAVQSQDAFTAAFESSGSESSATIVSLLVQARHATVHRIGKNVEWMEQVMQAAVAFGLACGLAKQKHDLTELSQLLDDALQRNRSWQEQQATLATVYGKHRADIMQEQSKRLSELNDEERNLQHALAEDFKQSLCRRALSQHVSWMIKQGLPAICAQVRSGFCSTWCLVSTIRVWQTSSTQSV